MSAVVIRAEGLGKSYHRGALQQSTLLRDQLSRTLKSPLSVFRRPKDETFWALKDVSFEVKEGEVLGLIGRNGAGKSTLLKILSRITRPTVGRARIHGRVGTLLEVGTGFHAELTGRENVFLNGAILGMGRREIRRKFDEIVAFSEIERFIDTPVKRYSSGMFVRLAFAVAAHLDPDILLVDEVLAVGDVDFQRKCLGKIKDVSSSGRTIIFVSHNVEAVKRLCDRSLVLTKGQLEYDGDTQTAISEHYMPVETARVDGKYEAPEHLEGPHVVRASVETSHGAGEHKHGEPVAFEFDIGVPTARRGLCFAFQIVNEQSVPVCHFWLYNSDHEFGATTGLHRLRCEVPRPRLFMGTYTVTTWLSDRRPTGQIIEKLEGICKFKIRMPAHREQYDWHPGECTYLEEGNWNVEIGVQGNGDRTKAGYRASELAH